MSQTLNQKTCSLIKERIGEMETEKYWRYRKGLLDFPKLDFPPKLEHNPPEYASGSIWSQCACPSTLPELIEMFKKIELVKGHKEYAVCNPCGAETDAKCQCDMPIGVQDWWLYHFLKFCELSAGDWDEAEKYLISIL